MTTKFFIAIRTDNPVANWSKAFDILTEAKATIMERFHGQDYAYSYWLYGNDKIYRQKLKPGAPTH